MASTKPSIEQITHILQTCSGQTIWNVTASALGLSFEVGAPWISPHDGKRYGERTFFIQCEWHVVNEEGTVISDEMIEGPEDERRAGQLLEGKAIRTISFNQKDHELLLRFDMEENLLARPNSREEDSCWTLFYVFRPHERYW